MRRSAARPLLISHGGGVRGVGLFLFVLVWLSDYRWLVVFVLLVLPLFVIIVAIVIVRVSGQQRIGDEGQPFQPVLREALDHVGITPADQRRSGNISAPESRWNPMSYHRYGIANCTRERLE